MNSGVNSGVNGGVNGGVDGGMVGRRSELAVLRSAADRAAAGAGAAILVLGEAGIGKSRLLGEASRRARAAGMEVLAGRAVAGGGAFRAIAVALAERLRERSKDDAAHKLLADEALRPFLPALRRLLPAWTPDAADQPEGADPIVVAGEGVLRLLRLLAADRGCLLLLEDLHWADADTLALVEYLAGAARSAGVLLVVSARDEGGRRAALTRMGLVSGVTVLRPHRLSAEETAALVAARAPDLDAARVDLVVAAADGLPLLVEELAEGLRHAPAPAVPPTFGALVEERLAELPDGAAEIVRAAAVLGADPPWALLSTITTRPEAAVLAGLRAATDVGLLVVADGELRWRHALTCDAVVGTALPPERAAFARRGAEALLARGGVDDGVRAAELLVVAGEDDRAATLLLGLARRDRARGAFRSAAALLDRVPAAQAADVSAERVLVLTALGRAADALDEGERALPTAIGEAHAELCLRLARAAIRAGQWGRASGYVERAGRPADPRTPLLAADAAFGVGDVARAAVLAADAVSAAERTGAAEPLCEALELVARCALQDGDLVTASAVFGRAASVAGEHGLRAQRVTAELGRGMLGPLEGPWQPTFLAVPRELAVEAGMLAEVARIDFLIADGVWTAEGPAAAAPVAEASLALAGALRLSALQAMGEIFLAGIRVTGATWAPPTACSRPPSRGRTARRRWPRWRRWRARSRH